MNGQTRFSGPLAERGKAQLAERCVGRPAETQLAKAKGNQIISGHLPHRAIIGQNVFEKHFV